MYLLERSTPTFLTKFIFKWHQGRKILYIFSTDAITANWAFIFAKFKINLDTIFRVCSGNSIAKNKILPGSHFSCS